MKFSIRDLLLATVIVALALGWWVDHRHQARANQTLFDMMRRETPWLVEGDITDWVANQMRKEAEEKRKSYVAPQLLSARPESTPAVTDEVRPAELAMTAQQKLRWHQLSLSTVLAATTAIAIGLGMRSNDNVACFVTELAGSLAVFVACEWSMQWWRAREEAWQPEFWRSFEKAEEEFREANRRL